MCAPYMALRKILTQDELDFTDAIYKQDYLQ